MKAFKHQNTKIIATVGPASKDFDTLLALAKAGVDVFRLNFSHGTHEDHQEVINHITRINDQHRMHIGILADLQGPKLRVGKILDNALALKEGDFVHFVNRECIGTKEAIYMSYPKFAKDVKPGERVLLDDGKLIFEVVETNEIDKVKLRVIFGGILSSNKGVNLPNTKVSLPCLTKKDLKDLDFILTQPVNWIALSFVRSPKDLKDLLKRIDAKNHPAKIIAKIEKPEAVKNIDEIIKNTNGIMIARGDLGIEVPIEQLPVIQKEIVRKCMQRARPVIVATQMMESMINSLTPSRAEVTDVANAVLDGADAVMLSGETSVGMHPVKVVEAMNRIIDEAEKNYQLMSFRPEPNKKSSTFLSDVVCFNAGRTAGEIGAKAIVGMTSSGYTAFKVSSFRPRTDICIFSDRMHMLATLNMVWGVRCFYYDKFTTTDETIQDVTDILKREGVVQPGDYVINTGSMPMHRRFMTNMLKVTLVE
ncbi:MAG: pyruvate kinase [Saprospirales bacterium]|nr:pyruvate kinase [Saprospirales bacterium]MBK8489582.1 pyruvate kinase [Saprospirales bacterium]